MNNVQQAIRDAAEKGGYRYRWWKVNDLERREGYNGLQLRALSEHLHDRNFWEALATARKWEDENAWHFHWHGLAEGRNVSIEFRWGTGGGAQMRAFASELIELRSRCQRSTLSLTISARNLPCSAVMRPTVMGRRKRRGPALPGLKKSVPFFVSILGWCE